MITNRDEHFVADTSLPLPRALLGRHPNWGLWALRSFVVALSITVIYTFASNLM
jgi:hypothetical protein